MEQGGRGGSRPTKTRSHSWVCVCVCVRTCACCSNQHVIVLYESNDRGVQTWVGELLPISWSVVLQVYTVKRKESTLLHHKASWCESGPALRHCASQHSFIASRTRRLTTAQMSIGWWGYVGVLLFNTVWSCRTYQHIGEMSSAELEPLISHSEGSSVLEVMREDGKHKPIFERQRRQ